MSVEESHAFRHQFHQSSTRCGCLETYHYHWPERYHIQNSTTIFRLTRLIEGFCNMFILLVSKGYHIPRRRCESRAVGCLVAFSLSTTTHQVCRKNDVTCNPASWRYQIHHLVIVETWSCTQKIAASITWSANKGAAWRDSWKLLNPRMSLDGRSQLPEGTITG